MKTKKQKELIDSFLRTLDAEDKSVYRDIIVYLSELGYNPNRISHSSIAGTINRLPK